MPRTRRTYGGSPAQSKAPVAGQTYGHGAEQQTLERALPTPNLRAEGAAQHQRSAGATVTQGAINGAARAGEGIVQGAAYGAHPGWTDIQLGAMQHQQALEAAAALRDQTGLLTSPTNRPNEPVTHGLSRGPGGGPEVLGMMQGTPTGDLFRRLSAELGDPFFARLADRARA